MIKRWSISTRVKWPSTGSGEPTYPVSRDILSPQIFILGYIIPLGYCILCQRIPSYLGYFILSIHYPRILYTKYKLSHMSCIYYIDLYASIVLGTIQACLQQWTFRLFGVIEYGLTKRVPRDYLSLSEYLCHDMLYTLTPSTRSLI